MTETCTARRQVTEPTKTREIEGRLHGGDGVGDAHTHTEVVEDNGGELAECLVTRCKQLDSLLQERRETLCSLEANHDQVSSVVSSELEGASAVDECTPSLGVMKAPEPLVVTRFPIVNVPVCVFTSVAKCVLKSTHSVGERLCVRKTACVSNMVCVVASVPKCVLPSTTCVDEAPCVSGTTCAREMAYVSERPCVRGTACVRSLCAREMAVGMREHATACPGVNVMSRCVSIVARRSVCVEWRRRRRQTGDRSRVAP